MRRRQFLGLAGGAALAAAGCLGETTDSPGDSTQSRTPTDSKNDDANDTQSERSGDANPDDETTVADENVVQFDSLSAEQKDAFTNAHDEPVIFSSSLPDNSDIEVDYDIGASEPFRDHEYVMKDGSLYVVQMMGPQRIEGTRVEVKEVDTPDDDTVLDLEERSGEGFDLIETAIERDGVAEESHVDRPDTISTGDIVELDGEYYEVTHLSIRDYAYFEMSVEDGA